MELGSPRPRVARERACGGSARCSPWLGVWCAVSLGKFWRSHVRERAVMNTWVSTWTAKSLT